MDPEEFIEQVLAYLRANLPPALATIKAAKGDDVPLDPPATADDYYFAGPPSLSVWQYPSVEVAVPDVSYLNPALQQVAWDTQPRVLIRAFLQHVRFDVLSRMAYRYGDALLQTMLAAGAFGPSESVERASAHWAVNPETEERAEFTAGVLTIYNLESMRRT